MAWDGGYHAPQFTVLYIAHCTMYVQWYMAIGCRMIFKEKNQTLAMLCQIGSGSQLQNLDFKVAFSSGAIVNCSLK